MAALNENDVKYDFLVKEIRGEELTEEEKLNKEKAKRQERTNEVAREYRDGRM